MGLGVAGVFPLDAAVLRVQSPDRVVNALEEGALGDVEGLAVARVLDRTRPKARVGVGLACERLVF